MLFDLNSSIEITIELIEIYNQMEVIIELLVISSKAIGFITSPYSFILLQIDPSPL